jgi:hypothetical protein
VCPQGWTRLSRQSENAPDQLKEPNKSNWCLATCIDMAFADAFDYYFQEVSSWSGDSPTSSFQKR